MKSMKSLSSSAALMLSLFAGPAISATATGSMTVRITIQSQCLVQSASILDFGTNGVLAAAVNQTSTITVQCTNSTPYNVGLGAGAGSGATVTNRLMTGPGAATIGYALYRDAARTLNWGGTVGTDTLAGTGNGSAQPLTVYGQVPAQSTPAAGVYTDTVAITVTY